MYKDFYFNFEHLVFQDKFGFLVSKRNQVSAQCSDDQEEWRGSEEVHKMNSPEQP